jgi:hypothetical protein
MGVARFERFFRAVAGLDVDKEDLKRYSDFVNHKVYDLLIRGEATAKANDRDLIEPIDLPITKGLQENIHLFKELDENIELKPILDHLTARPLLDLDYSEETVSQLSRHRGWTERSAGERLQDHRPRYQKSPNQALAAFLPDLRPAGVVPCDRGQAGLAAGQADRGLM